MRQHPRILLTILAAWVFFSDNRAALANPDTPVAAQALGRTRAAVPLQPDGLYIGEAEEFQSAQPTQPGWKAQRWGENYYAATLANSFLSRKAFLGAPEQCDEAIAAINIDVNEAGQYLVLVRYEAVYRFETQFRVQIEQNGKRIFDRLYGARKNTKIWAFGQGLKAEIGWGWGAVENMVWEGHDAFAELQEGHATIRLVAAKQPEPAAKRNVDLVMLTTDVEQVKTRIEKEAYLPLDGMLTQSGDVWLRVTNVGDTPLTFAGQPAAGGGNWQQHSPYWIHIRNWTVPSIQVEPGTTSQWVEVGGTMDSLNDGQWFWTGNGKYKAEFGLKEADGSICGLAEFTGEGDLWLAGDADTRYSRQVRKLEDVLFGLLDELKHANPAPHGCTPQQTIIYGSTFSALDNGEHAAAVDEFKQLFALADPKAGATGGRGHIDVRSVPTAKLAEYCENLGGDKKNIAVVSLGDEISLPSPGDVAATDEFRQWLQDRGLQPANVDPSAGDWKAISYNVDAKTKDSKPGVYYWSKRYQYHFGIRSIKERTDILRHHLPNAGIGANYSPHFPQEHMFLGEVFKWVTIFRQDGMTLPWSEDYIWQVPVGTPQMNNINLDLFRAGLRHHPGRRIHYYVMPHMPGNTPRQWRRLFYGALGHGMKIVNLFEFRPVHVSYTENHVDDPAMYRVVLRSVRELGLFEDIVQDGHVRPAEAALWFSETGDIWGDNHGSFAAAKRALYTAIRNQQIPLDFVVEQDALDGTLSEYKVLYLTDAHVSTAAAMKIAEWVKNGGQLFATAGAGMFDELDRPNQTVRELLGVEQTAIDAPQDSQVTWIKQDLPFTEPIQGVADLSGGTEEYVPVFCVRSHLKLAGAEPRWAFEDDAVAVTTHRVGKGRATCCAFLPGLSYYKPAIPKRPVDRGATDDSMAHFLPTHFDARAASLIASPAGQLSQPVRCSHALVETTVIESPHGVVIPLVNWSNEPIADLRVEVRIEVPNAKVSLASGAPVKVKSDNTGLTATFAIDEADALIFRN